MSSGRHRQHAAPPAEDRGRGWWVRRSSLLLALLAAAVVAAMTWPAPVGEARVRDVEGRGAHRTLPVAPARVLDRIRPLAPLVAAAHARAASTALPARSGAGRRVVYSRSAQRVWLVLGSGRVARTYLVSGRLREPRVRSYRVYSTSRWARSAVSPETMRLMVRFAHGRKGGAAIGFHTIPRDRRGRPAQTVSQLGRPISHGCVRQRWSDAVALWRFAPVGTRVVVTR